MVVVRLAKSGAKKNPYYFITVADSRRPRDGGYIERLGFFNPSAKGSEERLRFNIERFDHWLTQGAQASDKVSELAKDARLSPEDLLAKLNAKKDKRVKKKELLDAKKVAELAAQAEAEVAEAPAEEVPAEEVAAVDAVDAAKDVVEDVVEAVSDVAEDAVDAAQDVVEDVVEAVSDVAEDAVDAAKDVVEDIVEAVSDVAEDAVDAAKDVVEDGVEAVSDAVEDLVDMVTPDKDNSEGESSEDEKK